MEFLCCDVDNFKVYRNPIYKLITEPLQIDFRYRNRYSIPARDIIPDKLLHLNSWIANQDLQKVLRGVREEWQKEDEIEIPGIPQPRFVRELLRKWREERKKRQISYSNIRNARFARMVKPLSHIVMGLPG